MRFGHRNAIPLENRSRPEEPYSAIKPQPRVDPLDCFEGGGGTGAEIEALQRGSSRVAGCKVAGFNGLAAGERSSVW